MRKLFTLSVILLLCCSVSAQEVLLRSCTYFYIVPEEQSFELAKKTALERAKQQIIDEAFGTVVGVSNRTVTTNKDGVSSSDFLSISETETKGEWIGTVGTPVFERYLDGNNFVLKVTLTGKVRERQQSSIVIEARILKNGTDLNFESNTFKNNDDVFIYFKSPVRGYVAIYQIDNDGVFRLLPYSTSDMPSIPVKGGKEYLFFDQYTSDNGVSLYSSVIGKPKSRSAYHLFCNIPQDICQYFIIFSPNSFSISNDTLVDAERLPAMLDQETFQKWLSKVRTQDKDMVVLKKEITLFSD